MFILKNIPIIVEVPVAMKTVGVNSRIINNKDMKVKAYLPASGKVQ